MGKRRRENLPVHTSSDGEYCDMCHESNEWLVEYGYTVITPLPTPTKPVPKPTTHANCLVTPQKER